MTGAASRPRPLSGPRTLGYALGSLGTGVFSTVPAVLLLYFCTQILEIPPAVAAAIVFLPKAWSLLWDPFVGLWSDRTRSRRGRRRPFMLVGSAGVTLSFLALFAWPYGPPASAAFVAAALYFLLATSYSLFAVPYVAVPSEVSDDARARESLTAWRIGFGLFGVLVGAAAAPLLVQAGGGGRPGYAVMAIFVAGVCGLGMFSAFLATPSGQGAVQAGAARDVWIALRNREFRNLLGAYILQLSGVGVLNAMATYWVVFVLRRSEGAVGLALGALLLLAVIATPVWALIVACLGARRAIILAAVGYAILSAGLKIVPAASAFDALRIALFVATGLAFSGLQVAPFSLAAHVVHHHAEQTQRPQQALMTGLWTAGEKLGLAMGAAMAGLALSVGGFAAGEATQSEAAVDAISWTIALGPALLMLASLCFVTSLAPARPHGVSSASDEGVEL